MGIATSFLKFETRRGGKKKKYLTVFFFWKTEKVQTEECKTFLEKTCFLVIRVTRMSQVD